MKRSLLILIILLINGRILAQDQSKAFYNSDFKWTITIPQTFTNVDAEEWAKLQNKGTAAIEKTYSTKVENRAKNIFIFRSDQFNYFESNYQPFDVSKDGDYMRSCRGVDEIVYQTFKAQMKDIKIDTSFVTEDIGGLTFQVFKLKIHFPNDVQLNMMMFTRLFDKREFTVNVMYIDPKKGNMMLDAWRASKFEK